MHAFGIEIAGDDLPGGLHDGPGASGGRRVHLTTVAAAPAFPAEEAEELCDPALALSVRRHPVAGWRVTAPGFGTAVVSRDGTAVVSEPPAGPAWRRQRLLFAQVLPLAAVLQGVETLHAHAVVADGAVVGVVGGSGQGKSTLGRALAAEGARFFSDDALAITQNGDAILAHPGPRFAAVPGAPERFVTPSGHDGALPLRALFFLDRDVAHPAVSFAELRPAMPSLLAAAFVPYVRDGARHARLLDVLAGVGGTVALRRLLAPERSEPRLLAREVLGLLADGAGRR